MSNYYVYRYVHPEYPWLYVGKTKNLESRIRTHDFDKSDNIDRKYANLLMESSVYYLEFENSTQMSFVELYLIDKYSPYLNKKDNHTDESKMELSMPRWKKYLRSYELQESTQIQSKRLSKLNDKLKIYSNKIAEAESRLADRTERLSKLMDDNEFIQKYIEFSCKSLEQKEPINHEISVSEIAELFNEFPNYEGKFEIDTFNCFGNSESRIIDKFGLWTVNNFDYANKELIVEVSERGEERMNSLFTLHASALVSAVNHYSCTSLTPFVLLKQINEDRLTKAESEKMKYISEGCIGYAELKYRHINEYKEKINHYKEIIESHLSLYGKENGNSGNEVANI